MTIRYRILTSAGAAAALLLAASPAVANPASDAKGACRNELRRDYNASTDNVTASDRGGDRFSVGGTAERRGEARYFTCRTDGGRVSSLNVPGMNRESGGGNDAGKVAAGVGIAVGLAAIIAAATSKRKSHEYDRYENNQNNSGSWDNYYVNQSNDDSYQPASGVICYRRQRACYNSYDNNYHSRWSQREFGY